MPKAVREVKSFNLGVVTSADDNDIKTDAAVFSENIDPNSVAGRLRGRPSDRLLAIPKMRTPFTFLEPNTESDGLVPREIDIKAYESDGTTQLTTSRLYGDHPRYKVDVSLQGTIPSANVTIQVKVEDFSFAGTYIKINDTADTSGYPNSGEYIDLLFTSGNWQTVQTVYIVPQAQSDTGDVNVTVSYKATSAGDNDWNHTDRDFVQTYVYVSDVTAAVIIKRSTHVYFDIQESLQEVGRMDVKLSESPLFEESTSVLKIKFNSQDPNQLKADFPDGGTQANMKTLSFTNSNWDTYQTLYPYGVDDGVKDGNQTYHLSVWSETAGVSQRFEELDSNFGNCVRYDDGNFITNDWPMAGISNWPIGILELGSGDNDEGGGDSDDDGWSDKGGP